MKYIQDKKEQKRIALACHVDPTSGHTGRKKTAARIKERFFWKGVVKVVHQIVSYMYCINGCVYRNMNQGLKYVY